MILSNDMKRESKPKIEKCVFNLKRICPDCKKYLLKMNKCICQGDPVYMKRGSKPRREEPDHVFLRCVSFFCPFGLFCLVQKNLAKH